jgi:hypothetical protein
LSSIAKRAAVWFRRYAVDCWLLVLRSRRPRSGPEEAEEGAEALAAAAPGVAAPAAVEQVAVEQVAEAEDQSEAYLERIREPQPPITRARIALTSISLRMMISPLATPARSGM